MNIYDFDGTIYDGDSSIDFFRFAMSKNKKILFYVIPICFSYILYLIKIIEKEKFKSFFFKFVNVIDCDKYVEKFWIENENKIKQFYKDKHNNNDIIVSASPFFLLEPIAKKYKFKLIATNVDKNNGLIIGNNCYGEEKVRRLSSINIKECEEFYSDSLSDYPCAKLAKKSYIVKGNRVIPWNDYKLNIVERIIKMFFNRDFITFVFIGCINAFNGIWIAYVYSLFIENSIIAYIFGFFTSLLISYILNSKLNFKVKLSICNFNKFVLNNIPNLLIQVGSVVLLLNILEVSKIISYSISAVIAVPITFILVKLNVFKK